MREETVSAGPMAGMVVRRAKAPLIRGLGTAMEEFARARLPEWVQVLVRSTTGRRYANAAIGRPLLSEQVFDGWIHNVGDEAVTVVLQTATGEKYRESIPRDRFDADAGVYDGCPIRMVVHILGPEARAEESEQGEEGFAEGAMARSPEDDDERGASETKKEFLDELYSHSTAPNEPGGYAF
jgi:hypothetical protein